MGKQTIEIDVPDGYELAGQFTSTEGDKIVGIGYKLKPVKNKLTDAFEKKAMSLKTIGVPFMEIINQERLMAIDCAEECKKVAIDFHTYIAINVGNAMMEHPNNYNEFCDMTPMQIFDKFIEEEYQKQDLSSFTDKA